ncbi:MAG: cysteine desulfurase [Flavobacteriales bacterium]|nr:cysteine desulfurase [Flavobacteriales bacterium]
MEERVYLDNAATTPMDPLVIEAMTDVMHNHFGNPSATYSLGRSAKGIIEKARKAIAAYIGAESREILFTSGGTEADNMAIRCAVRDLGVQTIITSPIEHKAVLETAQDLAAQGAVELKLVELDSLGRVNYEHLEQLASDSEHALISIMHANNEIGTTVDLKRISSIARNNSCYFHSDTVQTMGHLPINVTELDIDFVTCSAHKLHGPKGTGFLYINKNLPLHAMITGGGQERSRRAGTENVVGIAGLHKALDLAMTNMEADRAHMQGLKKHMIRLLNESIPGIEFNGDLSEDGSLYTVLNVSLPPTDFNSLILFKMDIAGICCSGGSACNSGASTGSHVLTALKVPSERQAVRFSFGRYSSLNDIERAVNALSEALQPSLQTQI